MSLFGTMPEFAEAFASEERRKFAAPPEREAEECDPDEQEECDADADLFPYDEGYEARVCCRKREENPHASALARAEWERGWDAADAEPEDADTIFQPRAELGHGGSISGAGNTFP